MVQGRRRNGYPMACRRGHALATGRARDGSPRRRGALFTIQHRHRSTDYSDPSCQYLSSSSSKELHLTRYPGPFARPSTTITLPRRVDSRGSRVRTTCPASATRILWPWTAARHGNSPAWSDGPGPAYGNASANFALRRDDDHARTAFFLFSFGFFILSALGYELHSAGWRYTVICWEVVNCIENLRVHLPCARLSVAIVFLFPFSLGQGEREER